MLEIRSVRQRDLVRLAQFFAEIPPEDRTFFKDDVTTPTTLGQWLRSARGERWLAYTHAGDVVGYLALVPGLGWASQVMELRVVVHPDHRGMGYGQALARRGLLEAASAGARKVTVDVVASHMRTVSMFEEMGFEVEARLHDHLVDPLEKTYDLLIMTHRAQEVQSRLTEAGVVPIFPTDRQQPSPG